MSTTKFKQLKAGKLAWTSCAGLLAFALHPVMQAQSAQNFVAPDTTTDMTTDMTKGTSTSVSPSATDVVANSGSVLPDAPLPALHASIAPGLDAPKATQAKQAPKYAKYIASDETAYGPLTLHDKLIIGARDLYSIDEILAIVVSASYSQVLDGQPNYGHPNSYPKRLGAAAISDTAEGVFTDMVFAPLLHEDTRYFQLGHGHGFFPRTLYAITRPLITRTNSGRKTINGALLLGYASTAGLEQTYYPQINRNFPNAAESFGGSIGGAALGFFVSEFSSDVLHIFHHNN